MKKIIRLTESDLTRIVKRIINEMDFTNVIPSNNVLTKDITFTKDVGMSKSVTVTIPKNTKIDKTKGNVTFEYFRSEPTPNNSQSKPTTSKKEIGTYDCSRNIITIYGADLIENVNYLNNISKDLQSFAQNLKNSYCK
jgi:hypothetical protein